MDSDNSASLILRSVKANTTVLEFGPGNGYMTQYLKEQLNCNVHIVEMNEEDIDQAIHYSASALVGPDKGNIENYHWKNIEKCDHIIFADVLEHLYYPERVLKEAVSLLKDDGSILISIPNISHNSIIIDLINGKFEYRELGLLDNTHIRFFTRASLQKMVDNVGLFISKETNTFCKVEDTEFKNYYDNVDDEIASILSNRPDGILYQFIWELKKL